MTWSVYQTVFRLRSPLHIGRGKVGNLQRTHPYVTGRVLWGAFTMRLTRDKANNHTPATDSRMYQQVGQEVHHTLAFTYLYPATKSGSGYQAAWPWQDETDFKRRFLSSYTGSALSYPNQSAATGMLHEVEFISPNTLDTGEPVFIIGYVFEQANGKLHWQDACKRLQVGGERGYGWGDIELIDISGPKNEHLFDGTITFSGRDDSPIIHLPASKETPGHLLAHTLATNLPARGEVGPLVGREWRSHNPRHRHAGQHIEFSGVFFAPGSTVDQPLDFAVGKFGVWRRMANIRS
jgi:hypothetical protein